MPRLEDMREESRVTREDVNGYGWNTAMVDDDRPCFRSLAQQLNMIGNLLVDIRDAIEARDAKGASDA